MPSSDNPILPQIPDTFTSVPVVQNYNGEVVGNALASLAKTGSDLKDQARLSNYQQDQASVERSYQAGLERQAEALKAQESIIQTGPGSELSKQLKRLDLLKSQTPADPSVVMVMKEKLFRQWTTQFPALAPEFIKIALHSGLGSDGSSQETKFITDAYNNTLKTTTGELADAKTHWDRIVKDGEAVHLSPEDPQFTDSQGFNPDKYIAAVYGKTSEIDKYDRAVRSFTVQGQNRTLNGYEAEANAAYLITQSYPVIQTQIIDKMVSGMRSMFAGDPNQQGKVDPALAAQQVQQLVSEGKSALRAKEGEILRTMGPNASPDQLAKIHAQFQQYYDQVDAISKVKSLDYMNAGLKFSQDVYEAAGQKAVFPDPAGAAWYKMLINVAPNSPEARGQLKLLSSAMAPRIGAMLAAQATGINTTGLSPVVQGDGVTPTSPTANGIEELATIPGNDINKAWTQITNQILPTVNRAMNNTDKEMGDTIRAQGVYMATTYARSLGLYYQGGGRKAPPQAVVDGLFTALTDPRVKDIVRKGFTDPKQYEDLQNAMQFSVEGEVNTLAQDARKALLSAGATTVDSRGLTAAEKLQAIIPAQGSGMLMTPSSAADTAKVPVNASTDLHLEVDNHGTVTFSSNIDTPAMRKLISEYNVKYASHMSTAIKALTSFVNASPQMLLTQIESSTGFPQELVMKPKEETRVNGVTQPPK